MRDLPLVPRCLRPIAGCLLATVVAAGLHAAERSPNTPQAAATVAERVDALFARWSRQTPGCAVGVSSAGQPRLERAYGMADLEHDVPNQPDSIIEAGSVSKQFTAAAVLRLAQMGKLGLDDPVRQYVPELPDYGAPLTIRHLLTHTSGLRDWGGLAALAGWPRGARVHSHAHVLDILSRQRALNFAPGTRWSYSNSGYNLAAIIVDRVSGMSFAEFSRTQVFEPLGLRHTSWRDDYTRVVKGRSVAYARDARGYRQDMPFENVHGNGGLLTTVGDLLTWSERMAAVDRPWTDLFARQREVARLPDGRDLHYGLGLFVGRYRGLDEIYHSGSTAGYRAFLTRLPGEGLAVAVLCNAGDANATQLAHAVVDLHLGARAATPVAAVPPVPEARGPLAGLAPVAGFALTSAELAEFEGRYVSEEVESTWTVARTESGLVIRRRPGVIVALTPHSRDRFSAGAIGLVTFVRTEGRITGLRVTQDRVWALEFRIDRADR